jgi:hypothetical protein
LNARVLAPNSRRRCLGPRSEADGDVIVCSTTVVRTDNGVIWVVPRNDLEL